MVIYNKQEKIIIIPEGGGSTSFEPKPNCDELIAEAREEGYESGLTYGISSGYSAGYSSGRTDGYEEGYEQGLEDCSSTRIKVLLRATEDSGAPAYPISAVSATINGVEAACYETFIGRTGGLHQDYIGCVLETREHYVSALTMTFNTGAGLNMPSIYAVEFCDMNTEIGSGTTIQIQSYDYEYDDNYGTYDILLSGEYIVPTYDCSSAITEAFQSGYTVGYQTGSLDTIWEYWISIAFNIQGQGDYADLVKSQVSYTDRDGNEINPFDLQHNWLNYKGQVLSLFGNTQAFAYGVIKQNGYGSPQMGHLTIKAPEEGDFTSRYLYIRRKYNDAFASSMFECDAVEFAEDTQVSSIFKSVITDSSQFPMQQSFGNISRPIMTIDGVEGYYDTIPAGTHTLSFRGGSEFSDDMQIDITNFKGEIRIY